MQNLFDLLEIRYTTPARCAAALNVTRQAYHQARARRRLSDRAAIRAAALLDMAPGAALLLNATANDPTPIQHPTPNMPAELNITRLQNINYAHNDAQKKYGQAANPYGFHSITSQEQSDAIDLIRWVFAVANIRADSPRFAYYVSRWRVPDKITAAKAAGTFSDRVSNCPPIDPGWIRHVKPAMDAYRDFIAPIPPRNQPPDAKAASSGNNNAARKQTRRAA